MAEGKDCHRMHLGYVGKLIVVVTMIIITWHQLCKLSTIQLTAVFAMLVLDQKLKCSQHELKFANTLQPVPAKPDIMHKRQRHSAGMKELTCESPLLPRIGLVQSSSLIRSEMGSLPPGISPLSQNQSKRDVLSSALRFLPFVSSSCACSWCCICSIVQGC